MELRILEHHRDHLATIGIPRIVDTEPQLRMAHQHLLQQHRVAGGRAEARQVQPMSMTDGLCWASSVTGM